MEMTQRRWVQGRHLNSHNMLFGGSLLSWFDEDSSTLATICCDPNRNPKFLTVNFAKCTFHESAYLGDLLTFTYKLVFCGKTSLWVYGEVISNDKTKIFSGYVCLVSVDSTDKPRELKHVLKSEISVPEDEHWKYVLMLKEIAGK